MTSVGQAEIRTQKRVLQLLQDRLGYDYLGDWAHGENTETIWLVDWQHWDNNHFAVAEEVTVKGASAVPWPSPPISRFTATRSASSC